MEFSTILVRVSTPHFVYIYLWGKMCFTPSADRTLLFHRSDHRCLAVGHRDDGTGSSARPNDGARPEPPQVCPATSMTVTAGKMYGRAEDEMQRNDDVPGLVVTPMSAWSSGSRPPQREDGFGIAGDFCAKSSSTGNMRS